MSIEQDNLLKQLIGNRQLISKRYCKQFTMSEINHKLFLEPFKDYNVIENLILNKETYCKISNTSTYHFHNILSAAFYCVKIKFEEIPESIAIAVNNSLYALLELNNLNKFSFINGEIPFKEEYSNESSYVKYL